MKQSIRISSMVTLDDEIDSDIIEYLKALSTSHKLNDYIENSLRATLGETKEISIDTNKIYEELKEVRKKQDTIQEMCDEMYLAGKCGKIIGLEEKAGNLARAQFLISRQIKNIENKLQINLSDGDEYIQENVEKYEKAVEFILDNYSDVLKNDTKLDVMNDNLNKIVDRLERGIVYEENKNSNYDNIDSRVDNRVNNEQSNVTQYQGNNNINSSNNVYSDASNKDSAGDNAQSEKKEEQGQLSIKPTELISNKIEVDDDLDLDEFESFFK